MSDRAFDLDRTWYTQPTFRSVVWIIFAVILIASFVNGVLLKHNDFRNHYRLGEAFLQGRPYMAPDRKPFFDNYPVGRLMINAPLAVFPYRVARGVCWLVSIIALVFSLKMWHQMAQRRKPVLGPVAFAATAFSLGIFLPWVVRDLDDCGLQFFLLFFLTAAGLATMRHKSFLSGFFLALAATYKSTPVLFLPFMLYKRRWREAAWMTLFIIVLNLLLPMMFLGWQRTLDANGIFFARIAKVAGASADDPTANGVEPPRHVNRNLKLAIARFLQTYRPGRDEDGNLRSGHELFIPHPDDILEGGDVLSDARPHPLFFQFLDLSPKVTNIVATGMLMVFALVLAVLFRHKFGCAPPYADLVPEWAVVTALCALLSPLCWGQHLVLMIPALFLSMRVGLGRTDAKWRGIFIGIIAVIVLGPQRELIGKELWLIIHSYKLQTIASLLCLLLVLTLPKNSTTSRTSLMPNSTSKPQNLSDGTCLHPKGS